MKRYKKANEGIHAPEDVKEKAVRPHGRRSYTKWAGAVAAVLAIALIGGAAMWPGRGDVPSPLSVDGPGPRAVGQPGPSPYALSLAAYPGMVQFPIQEDYLTPSGGVDYSKYDKAHDAWRESVTALRSNTDYHGMMDGFLTQSTAQFLSGAGEENRVYAPLNAYMALSMLAETTGGNSRQQLLELLEVDSVESLRVQARALWQDNYRDDGVVTSIMANSLWLRDDMTYDLNTLDTLSQEYYASSFAGKMGSVEYTQALQDWLNEQTGGLLEEQAGRLLIKPETVLALASTVYFKAAWSSEFMEHLTLPDTFHAPSGDVETDFMWQSMRGTYYWGEHFGAVSLHFQDGGDMWLILPDEGYTVDGLLESGEAMEFLLAKKTLDVENPEVWQNQKRLIINLSMPKFDVSSDLDLIEGLKALGVTDVFSDRTANFDPLGAGTDDPLYVGMAQHAARVKVDEQGCEAAAYTVIAVPAGAEPPPDEEVEFTLDRPFLFAITGDSGLPLFTGVVNQPNG